MKTFPAIAAILLFSLSVFSQDIKPTPIPTDDVVKISTNLIQIDVSVTDKKGNIVTDLRRNEIEIFENGRKQDLSNFSFISNVRSQPAAVEKGDRTVVAPPPPSPRPEQVRRTIALVVDDLTLSFASTFWVKEALKKFVNEQMQDGDLVAIIRTGAGIGALQQFTNDKRQLLAAIEKVRFNMVSGKVGVFTPIQPTLKKQIDGMTDSEGNTSDLSGQIDADGKFERETNEYRESLYASGTLGALNFIIRGMGELPGRKSIMLLSDGFRLFVRDDKGRARSSRLVDSLRRLTDMANRAAVVVYTIDARGLIAPQATAEDNTWGMSSDQLERSLDERRNELFDTQDGLRYLARQTGGFALINQNDISRGIRRVLDDQSYYLVGYQPDDETFDPRTRRYNNLEVKVKREGLRVRYRSGFFGIADEKIQKPRMTPSQSILTALTSPFGVNDISLRLNALFAADEKDAMFLRSYLHVDAGDLTFTPAANGTYDTKFDLVAMSFGDNGVPLDELSKTYTVNLKEDAYRRIREKGFVYHFTFPVKKAGGYQLRVALRDSVGNKVGSANQFIEVPNLKKDRLTLSGIVFESMEAEQWQKLKADVNAYTEIRKDTDPQMDTSLRQFKPGRFLRFGYEIYNAKQSASRKPDLSARIRLFREGQMIFDGPAGAILTDGSSVTQTTTTTGGFRLGEKMELGDYVLQIVVTDNLAKGERKIATQFVQFEVVG